MVKEIQYTSIKRVLDDLTEHPLLRDLTLEQVVRYTIRFIGLHGHPKFYQDKIDTVEIEDFKGLLPCDLVSINQVKDLKTKMCLRAMTDTFASGMRDKPKHPKPLYPDLQNNVRDMHPPHHPWYIPPACKYKEEPAFKTQGRIIYTSFPHGVVEISYKSIPVDENGYPMLIDNENYLACLEAYIKKLVFTMKFDTGKINAQVLMNAQAEYSNLCAQLRTEFSSPSMSEMESITRMLNTMIPKVREFDSGFKHMSDREYLRKH
jgi:hypothetical protein